MITVEYHNAAEMAVWKDGPNEGIRVPVGTIGEQFWKKTYPAGYTSVGIRVDGAVFFTYAKHVREVQAVETVIADDEPHRMIDLSDDPVHELPPALDTAPRIILEDDDDGDLSIAHIAPKQGEQVIVAGAPGWYGPGEVTSRGIPVGPIGDTFFTTSQRGYDVAGCGDADDAVGITAKGLESAAMRARRLGGMDWTTRLVPLSTGPAGLSLMSHRRYALVRNGTDEILAIVGGVSAQQGKGTFRAQNPAPLMLQPAALDILDELDIAIDRGGCIGGTVPWLQCRSKRYPLPNGDFVDLSPTASNPLDGSGSFALTFGAEVVGCRNNARAIFGAVMAGIKLKHCKSSNEMLKKLRAGFSAMQGSKADALIGEYSKMATVKANRKWVEDTFLPRVFQYGGKTGRARSDLKAKSKGRIERFWESYENAPARELDTGHGALQGLSHMTTYSWQGEGQGATEDEQWGVANAYAKRAVQAVRVLVNA